MTQEMPYHEEELEAKIRLTDARQRYLRTLADGINRIGEAEGAYREVLILENELAKLMLKIRKVKE